MRIAHLISHFPLPFVGGAEACVHSLAKEQTKMGHMVKVIAPKKRRLHPLNYEVLPLFLLKPLDILSIPVINKHLLRQLELYQDRYRFDIWQVTMGFPFGVATVDFFRKKDVRCVLRCSGEDIQREPRIRYGKRINRMYDFLIRKNYPKFDGLVSIVDSISKHYEDIGVPNDKIYFVRNGVNKSLFDIEVSRDEIKKNMGIDPNKKIILTVGRNHPKKGFHYIPDIIKRLARDRDDFVWVLIGHDNDVIKKEAERKGVGRFLITKEIRSRSSDSEELLFPGRELVALYKSADIFTLPSLIEGCSNVIVEAMSAGLPVVSTYAEGVRDIVKDGKTGLLSRKDEPEGIAENIKLLLDGRRLYEMIKKNALKEVEDLDWPIVAGRYIDVYKDVIKRKRGKEFG